MKHILLTILAILTFASCARDRGVEALRYDVRKDWQNKINFLGTGSEHRDAYYSKVTVVNNSADGGFIFVGSQTDMRVGYFDFTEKSLIFKSMQGPYLGRETSSTNNPVLYSWPITHHEAELQQVDGKTINKEIDDDRKKWSEKSKFLIDFAVADVTEENVFYPRGLGQCWKVESRRRVDNSVQVENGYISFVIEVLYSRLCPDASDAISGHTNFSVQYRYSFRKVTPSDYEPMVYEGEQDPRMRKYGYFQSTKENLVNGERKNLFFVNRWHPQKTHYFYFTKDFPEKYKFIYRDIFAKTNQIFIDKGLKVRFQIEENDFDPTTGSRNGKAKELGDLRYSFINLVETLDPSAPLGYGPSDADPFTGEIISSTVNVWSAMITNYLRRLEQSYFRNASEAELQSKLKWNTSTLYQEMKKLLNENDPTQWASHQWPTDTMDKVYNYMLTHTVYTYPGWNMFTAMPANNFVEVVVDRPVVNGFEERTLVKGVPEKLLGPIGSLPQMDQEIKSHLLDKIAADKTLTKTSFGIIDYQPLENSLLNTMRPKELQTMDLNALKDLSQGIKDFEQHELDSISENYRGHCKLAMGESLAGVERFYIDGFTSDEIAYNIIYRTSIHELGHNLNLRHNFYGSVDRKNFLAPSVPKKQVIFEKNSDGSIKLDKNRHPIVSDTKPVLDANGKQVYWPTISSSVMDYLRLQDDFYTTLDWEPYDVAALAYAYSSGKIDQPEKNYLYCSDEHTITSAVCNRFDSGSTPSEIMMSFIDTYEDGYYTRNYRFERQYWDTSGYMSAIISLMKEMKEFLPMWRGSFYSTNIQEVLKNKGVTKDKIETDEIVTRMDREMKQAIRLGLAFYQSVLLQKDTDKPFRSVYELGTGALQRMGIANDKLVAMYFLAGDDEIYYNPNRVLLYSSYMTYANVPEFAEIMDKITENIVTQRVDMEPWFISYGRQLYAQSSMNYVNRDNEDFINKIKVKRYTIDELEKYFNYKFDGDNDKVANLVTLEQSKDYDFKKGEEVAIVGVNSKYYMFSKQGSPFAYDIYKGIKQSEEFQQPTVEGKLDLQELFYIYTVMSGGTL